VQKNSPEQTSSPEQTNLRPSPRGDAGRPVRLVQFTDCHLGAVPGETLLNLNTDESFFDVLQLIEAREQDVSFLLCTGDIASAGNPACYDRFYNTIKAQFPYPLAWLPGNHDSSVNMDAFAQDKAIYSQCVSSGPWQIILLDSAVSGQVHGNLAEAELARLDDLLASNPELYAVVMLHHQPQPVGSRWIDQYTLRNADALFKIIDRYPQVKAVVWGHVHQAYKVERKGVLFCSAPSTCIQFKPDLDEFIVDDTMPGYRWFDLHADGSIDTGVERIPQKNYPIDYSSNGY